MPDSPAAVRAQTERIAASPGFAEAGRLAPFLRFVVESALEGRPVKEAVIGVEVFGRPADYDPRVDPIVRVEARRLRGRLAEYYQGAGASDPVLIDLPKGAYIPVFTFPGKTVPAAPSRSRRRIAVVTVALAVLLAAGIWAARRSAPRAAAPVSVAVLPFVNLSGDKSNEYFSDGLTEEITDRLAKAGGLHVVARSSAFQFRGPAADLGEIGRKLNAEAVVEGSVRTSADRVRVTAQLVKVADGYHLWSQTYERKLEDVFAMQDDIARSVAQALRVELAVGFQASPAPPTRNLDAYNLYLKARYQLNHNSLGGFEVAVDELEQAVRTDPAFAAAHAQLSVVYGFLGYYGLRPPAEIWPKARLAATRAIGLDDRSADAHAALGLSLGLWEWRWADSEREFQKAVALNPASGDVRAGYALSCLIPQARYPEALEQYRQAVELEPDSFVTQAGASFGLLAAGRTAEAIEHYRKLVELSPSHADGQWDLGMAYAFAGDKEDAMKQFRIAGAIYGSAAWRPGPMEYALLGQPEEARRLIAASGGVPKKRSIFVAHIYGVLGDADNTVRWLEKAFAERDPQIVWIKADPRFAKVRSDPRFQALVKKLGL